MKTKDGGAAKAAHKLSPSPIKKKKRYKIFKFAIGKPQENPHILKHMGGRRGGKIGGEQ